MTVRRVHVVDDEEAIRRSMDLMLRVLGYEAQCFESGPAFLSGQSELSGGCLLLDLRMPEIDGLEVQRRLNGMGAEHSVIVMSGHGDLGMAVTAMEQGAVAFLEKPFTRAALQRSLELAFMRIDDADGYRDYLRSAVETVRKLDTADQRVLELMAQGQDSEGIARRTGMPPMSIELARSRIYAELGAQTATDVLRLAFAARRADSY